MLTEGSETPTFVLTNQNGDSVDLATLRGKALMIYFYPKANTPGCTQQTCLLNDIRRSKGLRPFKLNAKLSRASQRHTNAMTSHKFFAHGDFVGRIRATRYLSGAHGWTVGENIAWGSWDYATPASIVDGWMHSPPHRHNILNGKFREIGIGVSRGAPVGGQDRAATYGTDFGTRY